MSSSAIQLSIIIPLRNGDESLSALLAFLEGQKVGPESSTFEIIVSLEPGAKESSATLAGLRTIHSERSGRPFQLNAGALVATGKWLWFVHADSRISSEDFRKILVITKNHETKKVVYYSWLAYAKDSPWGCYLNALGANLRSFAFKRPFGDQGLLVPKFLFNQLRGFPLEFDSAEDHAFVQLAHMRKVPIVPSRTLIETSGRKYGEHGWLRTTLEHVRATVRQEISGKGTQR